MPTFNIGLEDGRTLRIDADDQQAALAGAQHFMENAGPRTNAWGAGAEGFLDTAGLGFRDEIRGLAKASGLPEWMGGYRAIPGGIELAAEKFRNRGTDTVGPVQQAYEAERDFTRGVQRQSQEEHPRAYLGGQVGGGVTSALTMPGWRAAEGAGMLGRAAAAAKTGAAYGGAYGFGSGEGGLDSLSQGLVGAGMGAAVGAVASPLVDVAGFAARKGLEKAGDVYQWIRAEANPGYIRQEATRRILQARTDDAAARGMPLTAADRAMAQRAGIDLATADLGGDRTLALARSAANQSPEARGALSGLAQDRFEGQQQRAASFIREITGGADAAGDLDAIRESARAANRPAYARAYEAGDRPIWSPELERLTNSPDIQAAMKSAIRSGQSRAVEEGFGSFNPGVSVTPDGRILFGQSMRGGGVYGTPTYPNIQYWDYVGRDLRDMAEKVAGREPDKFRYLNGLNQALNTELDRLVPEYQQARVGAWRHFQAEDAVEAGKNFASAKLQNADFGRHIARMNDSERNLFARGYASQLADKVLESGNRTDLLRREFLTSQAAKARHQMALGPDRARQLEAYLHVETQVDRLRQALGNSTTARQLHELGMAGGAGLGMLAGEEFGGEHGGIWGTVLALGGAFAAHGMAATRASVATEIGRMLASQDPAVFARGVNVVSRTPWMMDALRRAGGRLDTVLTRTVEPQLQQPAAEAERRFNQ